MSRLLSGAEQLVVDAIEPAFPSPRKMRFAQYNNEMKLYMFLHVKMKRKKDLQLPTEVISNC